jgi:hypothetical protein
VTYTYVILKVSSQAYQEIKAKLEAAGYQDQFHNHSEHGLLIDMHGIALEDGEKA